MNQRTEAVAGAAALLVNLLLLAWAIPALQIQELSQKLLFLAVIGTLIALAVSGWVTSWRASRWSRNQMASLGATPPPPESVLGVRVQLLERMAESSLAEGDLGRFLLRREPIPGQGSAAFTANLLVSLALFCTVVGLCVVLSKLSASLPDGNNVSNIFQAVREPLSYFPRLFLPTAEGLFLAVLLTWRQRHVDEEAERAWQRIDDHTELQLLPRFLPRRVGHADSLSRLSQASQDMAASAGAFKQAGEQMAQVIPQLHAAVEKLENFDTKVLSEKLNRSADAFEKLVSTSHQALSQPAELIATASQALDKATERVGSQLQEMSDTQRATGQLANQLADATEKVGKTMSSLDDKLERLGDLETTLGSLSHAVGKLDTSFAGHSKDYLVTIQEIRSIVTGLRESLEPLLVNVENVQRHGDQTARELEKFTDAFRSQSQEMNASLQQYPEQLRQLLELHLGQAREEHSTFQAELSNYFTQGPELFQGLQSLGERLEVFAKQVEAAENRLGSSESKLEQNQTTLAELARQLEPLGQSMEAMAFSERQKREDFAGSVRETGEKLQGELGELRRELGLSKGPATGWRRFLPR